MHINDSQASAPTSTAGKQPVPDERPAEGRSRSGPRFRRALERRPTDASVDGSNDGASAAAMAGWFRGESASPPAPATLKTTGVAGIAAARPADRVLIGAGPDGAQARIRIGAGVLAGTEIQVSSLSGRTVEAQLLTHAASSRQTLSVVMDEIRSRLQDKGIALTTRAAAARSPAPPAEAERIGGGAAYPRHARGAARSGG